MDIVSRLKKFITYAKVPVTQFADNCNIARPTLSQLLNGRNKKVSDELISKIHEAYPTLSVLWLMFGEGDMLTEKNIETSQPQNDAIFSFDDTQSAKDEEYTTSISFDKIFDQNEADIFSDDSTAQNLTNRQEQEEKKESKAHNPSTASAPAATISFNSDQKKTIVNIIVYYSDNSFESFIPNPHK